MLQLEILISELAAIDGLATSAIVVGEVSTLAHEVGDDTVENATLVTETLFSCAESTEVFSSFGHNITPQLKEKKYRKMRMRQPLALFILRICYPTEGVVKQF